MGKQSTTKAIWRKVELLLCFYRDQSGKALSGAKTWAPKNAQAGIHRNPELQETIAIVRPDQRNDDREVMIRFRQDQIALRRDEGQAWSGVLIQDDCIHVRVNGRDIAIDALGQIKEHLLPERDAG